MKIPLSSRREEYRIQDRETRLAGLTTGVRGAGAGSGRANRAKQQAFFILAGLGVLVGTLALVAATAFSYAAYTTALAVLYHNQRLRKDSPLPAPSQDR
jgi:hypothetical protein